MQTDGWLVGERIRRRFVWRQPGGVVYLALDLVGKFGPLKTRQ